jgi:hypothetical protein
MKNQKILILDGSKESGEIISKLESFIPTLQQLNEIFESLDIGKLDKETAISLLKDKGKTASEKFLTVIAADCLSTGAKNKHFLDQQIKSQQPFVNEFVSKVEELLHWNKGIDFTQFSFSDEIGYFLPYEAKEAIRESQKQYLSNDNDIEYYNAVQTVCDAIRNLNNLNTKYTGIDRSNIGIGSFNKDGKTITRLENELKLLNELITEHSENPEPDAVKFLKFKKQFSFNQ